MTLTRHIDRQVKQVAITAIHGVEPESLAYGMAKYSRSALPLIEAIKEISSQKAEQFLQTFYFQYGHKSIADMAHIALDVSNISLLAAIDVVDEQRWDGQERSTRYQDFSKREHYRPVGLSEEAQEIFDRSIERLFTGYDKLFAAAMSGFEDQYPKPADMDQAAYTRTLRARSFDVARYLLPTCTLTSLAQVVNARTLESQVSRLLGSRYPEVREIGVKMKAAATVEPAYNPQEFAAPVYAAPTLVKYAAPNEFQAAAAWVAQKALDELDLEEAEFTEPVQAFTNIDPELEIVTTVLYEQSHHSFKDVMNAVLRKRVSWRENLLAGLLEYRGKYDELPRSFRAEGGIVFDICMDIGGMRDMHRHRRATHIVQPYKPHGFALPEPYLCVDTDDIYTSTITGTRADLSALSAKLEPGQQPLMNYLLPLGAECRFLMKMDVAEAVYVAELRSGPAGHISYRRIAWEIYRHLRSICPTIADGVKDRVTDPDTPLDFFKR